MEKMLKQFKKREHDAIFFKGSDAEPPIFAGKMSFENFTQLLRGASSPTNLASGRPRVACGLHRYKAFAKKSAERGRSFYISGV